MGKQTNVEEIMKEVSKDAVFYEESGGGITISGGEPLMQLDFLNGLLDECKKRDIHTAVDTCGFSPQEAFYRIRDKVDLFLYDIKMIDEEEHMKYTGVSNKLILGNLSSLAENGSEILIRFAVIPGVNDGEDNITKTAGFLVSHGIDQICLLPYHRAGIEKYRSLGRTYKMRRTRPPSDESLSLIKEKLETYGLRAKIG